MHTNKLKARSPTLSYTDPRLGVVKNVMPDRKIEIHFRDGVKVLVHGR